MTLQNPLYKIELLQHRRRRAEMKKIILILITGLIILGFTMPIPANESLVLGSILGLPGDMARYISIKVSNQKEASLGFRIIYDPNVIQITAVRSLTGNPNVVILTNLNRQPFRPGNLSFGLSDFSYNQLIKPGMLREVGRIYFNILPNAREGTYILKVGSATGISSADVMIYTDGTYARPDIFDGQLIITTETKLKPLAGP